MSNPPSSPPSVPNKIVPASIPIRRQSIRHSIDFTSPTHLVSHKQPHLSPSKSSHAPSKPYFSATHYTIIRILCSNSVLSRGDLEAWKKLLSKEKLPVPYTTYDLHFIYLFCLISLNLMYILQTRRIRPRNGNCWIGNRAWYVLFNKH